MHRVQQMKGGATYGRCFTCGGSFQRAMRLCVLLLLPACMAGRVQDSAHGEKKIVRRKISAQVIYDIVAVQVQTLPYLPTPYRYR